jgi:hypothetical protein
MCSFPDVVQYCNETWCVNWMSSTGAALQYAATLHYVDMHMMELVATIPTVV